MRLSDTTLFLKEALANPRHVGAVLPSSENLAAEMAACLPTDHNPYVLELGPGTGKVTRALLEQGLDPSHLVAIERSERLSDHLRKRFPDICVLTGDALALEHLIASQNTHRAGMLDAVISSLPLRNFSTRMLESFCHSVSSVLRPGGVLVQYSYHIHRGRIRALDGLQHDHSSIVWRNMPPARVYVYRNQPASRQLDLQPIALSNSLGQRHASGES